MTIFTDLISNVALLLALSILYSFLTRIWKKGEIRGQILTGILFGGVAVAGMILPFRYGSGMIFDGRSIVMSMAGLFGGPVTAAISTLIAGSYRLGLGGTGAFTGFFVIFTSAALGVCYHYLRLKNPAAIKPLYLFVFGVIVHISMLLWMLTLPWPLAFEVLNKISIPVMLIFPLGTVFLGTLLVDQEERNYAQEALRESEDRYRLLVENQTDMIVKFDTDGRLTFVSPSYCKVFDKTQDELLVKNFIPLIHEDDREAVEKAIDITYQPPYTSYIEERAKTKDGWRWQAWLNTAVLNEKNEVESIVAVGRDINERKLAEDGLRESEEKYRQLSDSLPQVVFETDEKGNLTFTNRLAFDILGYTREDFEKGLNALQMLIPEDHDRALKNIQRVLKGEKLGGTEYTALTKDGHRYPAMVYSTPIISEGKSIGMRGIVADLTEVKRAEEALRDVERRNQALLDHSPVCHKIVDLDFNLTYMSNNGYKMLQFDDNADVYGKPYPFEFFPAAFRNEMTENLKKVKETGDTITMEALANDIEGNEVWLDSTLLPVLDDDGRIDYITVVSANTTQRKLAEEEKAELESQLHRAQKMEAMGLMAGGVAHDLNNILSGVVSLPELLLMNLPEDSPIRKPIKTIQDSGMRAADVVEDLMTIARGVASSKEPLNLNTMVEEYLKSAEHLKLERTHSFVSFKTELDPPLLNMSGSPIHIKKILMNLVANASEAIEGSGTVTISTLNQYLDMPLKGYEDVRTGEYTMLAVSDDGTGISPEDLERIFEPFYTKKVMGRAGTGLGLAVVWNTTQDYNGYINVNSSEKGTTFELYFPVTREKVAAEEEEVPLKDYLGHSERILVVDDDENQREISSGMLTQLGYNAESVSSGEDAIEYIKEHSVDLIVLDMVMPKGINGRKTYEEIIKIRPGQKAIIASGHAQSKEVDIAQELGAGRYVKKPYILEKIGVAVKEELEK